MTQNEQRAIAHSKEKTQRSFRTKNYVKMNAASKEREALIGALNRQSGRPSLSKSKKTTNSTGAEENGGFDKLGNKCHLQRAMVVRAEAGDGGKRPPVFQQVNPVEKYMDLRDKMEREVHSSKQVHNQRKQAIDKLNGIIQREKQNQASAGGEDKNVGQQPKAESE